MRYRRVCQNDIVKSVLPTGYNQLNRVDSASAYSGRRFSTQLTSSSALCPMTSALSQSFVQGIVVASVNLSPAFCKMLSLRYTRDTRHDDSSTQ